MKKIISLTMAILFAAFNVAKPQSPPAWGIAPLLTATVNGNTLTYTTNNYLTQNPATTSFSSYGWKLESEGIGVYSTNTGTCYATTYDPAAPPSGSFKSINLASSSSYMNHGIRNGIAYCHNQYAFNAATYDPFRLVWKVIPGQNNLGIDRVEDGIIVYRSYFNALVFGIYDPAMGAWMTTSLNEYSYTGIEIDNNIVMFVSDANSVIGFAYDFEDHTWHEKYLHGNGMVAELEGGVISCMTSVHTKVLGMVYDFDAHDWISFESPTANGQVSYKGSNQGTIYYHNSSEIHQYGYDFVTRTWEEGQFTKAKCNLLEYQPTSNPQCVSFVTTYNIGGQVTSITCTDGYGLNRPWGYKPFLTPGYFSLGATITNSFSESLCEQYVFYNHTLGSNEISLDKVDIYPNPTSTAVGIHIAAPKNIRQIQLINLLGVTVAELSPSGTEAHLDLPTGISAGNYVLEVVLAKGETVRKKILVQ